MSVVQCQALSLALGQRRRSRFLTGRSTFVSMRVLDHCQADVVAKGKPVGEVL
ncbi:MAG: hypothetical protein JWQ42_3208 [Edaphobacter sp.]|nr:hypothetical protein [Edaphobacter sp.]